MRIHIVYLILERSLFDPRRRRIDRPKGGTDVPRPDGFGRSWQAGKLHKRKRCNRRFLTLWTKMPQWGKPVAQLP